MSKKIWFLNFIFVVFYSQLSYSQDFADATKLAKNAGKIVENSTDNIWTFGGSFQAIVNQSFSKNWVGASNPTIGGQVLGNLFLKYNKNKFAWENTLDVEYGIRFTFNPKPPKGIGTKYEKMTDKLDYKTKLGLKAGGNWYYGAMVALNTQLTNGYDPDNDTLRTSTFMTPGYLTFSVGMDYKQKKWSWYISPIGAKIISKTDNDFFDSNAFGVKAGKKCYMAVGASTHLVFAADIHKKINLNTKLELFYDYLGEYKQLRNLDVRYDMTWMFNITQWLSLSIKASLLYDYDIKFNSYDENNNQRHTIDESGNIVPLKTDHLQFQEAFGLTLGYKFKLPEDK